MKRILFAFSCLLALNAAAQKPIVITEASESMSKGVQPAFTVEIPQAAIGQVEKDWLDYTGKGTKGKATFINGEHLQPAAVNTNISPTPFNVYAKLVDITGSVRLTAWFTANDTLFFKGADDSVRNLAIEKYMRDFAAGEYRDAVKGELKGEQEKLKALEKDLAGIIKEEEKSTKKINESNRAIKKSQDNIAANNKSIENTSEKIATQKGMVERTASDANANKGAKQTLKDLENERKKLQKDNVNENKNIEAQNKAIREEDRNTALIKERIAGKNAEIDKQKEKVKEVQTKLEGIK